MIHKSTKKQNRKSQIDLLRLSSICYRRMARSLLLIESYLNCQDHNGFTCLIEASIEGDIRLVSALLSYEKINADLQLKGRDTALDYSCIHGNPAINKLLLKKGANPTTAAYLYFPGRRNNRECMRLVEVRIYLRHA